MSGEMMVLAVFLSIGLGVVGFALRDLVIRAQELRGLMDEVEYPREEEDLS